MFLAGGCAAVCTVASVKLVLLAAPGVVSLSAVGVLRVSAIVILSSPLSEQMSVGASGVKAAEQLQQQR